MSDKMREADIRGRIESMVLKGLKDGAITATEDIQGNEHISSEDLLIHLDFVLDRLEEEGKIVLTPMSFGDVGDHVRIELLK